MIPQQTHNNTPNSFINTQTRPPPASGAPSFWTNPAPQAPPFPLPSAAGGAPPVPLRPRSVSPLGFRGPILSSTPPPEPSQQYDTNDSLSRARSQALSSATARRQKLEQQIAACQSLLQATQNPLHQSQLQEQLRKLSEQWHVALKDERTAIDAVTKSVPFPALATPNMGAEVMHPPPDLIFPSPSPTSPHLDASQSIVITSEDRIPNAVTVKDLGSISAAASSRGLKVVTTKQTNRVKERLREAARLVGAHAVVKVSLRRDAKTGDLYGEGRAVKLVWTGPR